MFLDIGAYIRMKKYDGKSFIRQFDPCEHHSIPILPPTKNPLEATLSMKRKGNTSYYSSNLATQTLHSNDRSDEQMTFIMIVPSFPNFLWNSFITSLDTWDKTSPPFLGARVISLGLGLGRGPWNNVKSQTVQGLERPKPPESIKWSSVQKSSKFTETVSPSICIYFIGYHSSPPKVQESVAV